MRETVGLLNVFKLNSIFTKTLKSPKYFRHLCQKFLLNESNQIMLYNTYFFVILKRQSFIFIFIRIIKQKHERFYVGVDIIMSKDRLPCF